LKKIIKQIAGSINEEDGELIPEIAIKGTGYIFCYCPIQKSFVNISRGIKAYVVQKNWGHNNNVLVYTSGGQLVELDENEIIYTRFD
tara:strand:+ start:1003 stop:1263 length:261 start_codon:yes stop_codon:yes gene_type:complete